METGLQLLDLVVEQNRARKREASRRAAWAIEDVNKYSEQQCCVEHDEESKYLSGRLDGAYKQSNSANNTHHEEVKSEERDTQTLSWVAASLTKADPIRGEEFTVYAPKQLCLSDVMARRSRVKQLALTPPPVQLRKPQPTPSLIERNEARKKQEDSLPEWVQSRLLS